MLLWSLSQDALTLVGVIQIAIIIIITIAIQFKGSNSTKLQKHRLDN